MSLWLVALLVLSMLGFSVIYMITETRLAAFALAVSVVVALMAGLSVPIGR